MGAALVVAAALCACQAPGADSNRGARTGDTGAGDSAPPPPPVPDGGDDDSVVGGVVKDAASEEPGPAPTDAGTTPEVPETPETAESCAVTGCPPGLMCEQAGYCVTPPPACSAVSDCTGTQRCGLTGECLPPGACKVNGDCEVAESCRAGVCTLGTDCGQTELTIEPVPPNVLVLLDVSWSMNETLVWGGPSKWEIARGALNQMIATYGADIRWGLAMFPGSGSCGAPANVIAPLADAGAAVTNKLAATSLSNKANTPINASLTLIEGSSYLSDADRANYLLFVSDGGETCSGSNSNSTTRIQAMAAAGIKTFVVGFGSGVDGAVLDDFANAGGVPNTTGNTAYYKAESASALQAELGAILGSVVGCEFELTTTPQDASMVWAFLDDVQLERDSADGWTLDAANNRVTFNGAACDQLRNNAASDVDIVFGCPEPVLE